MLTDEELEEKLKEYMGYNRTAFISSIVYEFGESETRIKEALNRILSKMKLL